MPVQVIFLFFLKKFGYRNVDKLKKVEASKLVIQFIKEEQGIDKILKVMTLRDYKLLNKVMKNNGILDKEYPPLDTLFLRCCLLMRGDKYLKLDEELCQLPIA